jgi:hypothetical protein
MPVMRDKVDAGLGAEVDGHFPHSSNPRSLHRALEHPTRLDLVEGDVEVAAEAALTWVKPLIHLAEAGHSLPVALF